MSQIDLSHEHSTKAIRERLEAGSSPSYLRDWIYGGIDGGITTFAIVSGVIGANFSTNVILILGAANILADGFSMAASNYTGTKAENDDFERIRAYEERQLEKDPEGERREIEEIYRNKGFSGDDLERATSIITADRKLWIETMMVEEYGLPTVERSPYKAALGTFFAFLACGLVPLIPFLLSPWLLDRTSASIICVVITAATFFLIGSAKSKWSLASWWKSGLETFAIGMGAAGIAFLIGFLLRDFAG